MNPTLFSAENIPSVAESGAPISGKTVRLIRPGARIFLSRIFAGAVAAALMMGRNRWETTGAVTPEVMLLMGLALATLAMAGRMWCSLFIAGRKNAELVTQGPYALCRNPLYFFSLIGAVGVGLASGMVTVSLVIVLGFALYYPVVIRREEAWLHRMHGERFAAYARSVPAFWPRRAGSRDAFPESIECHSRVFVRHLTSAVWFPIVCGGVYVVGILHRQGMTWPAWFVLP